MISTPLFSVIIHTYDRIGFLKQSCEAVINQTYDRLEIIIIDNGGPSEIKEYLSGLTLQDNRCKILNYEENQFSWNDPMQFYPICFNDALMFSKGNYIWAQEDDEIISNEYIEKMVQLFQGHSECISAAGRAVSIDSRGNVNKEELDNRKSNYRSRYMPGHLLALQNLEGKNVLFSSPGMIFSFRRNALLQYGGFHRACEYHQLYGVVPFGITGFDDTAHLFWRRHEGQLNKALASQGWIGTKELFSMVDDLDIEAKWRVFGDDTARYVVKQIKKNQTRTAAVWFVINLCSLRMGGALRIFRDTWRVFSFWSFLPGRLWRENQRFFRKTYSFPLRVIKYILRPVINPIRRRLSKSSSLIAKD